jgi:hypothetical protein
MLAKLSDFLQAWAKGSVILFIFTAIVVFMAVSLPLLGLIYPAGGEMVSLDDPAIHSPEEIFRIIESWGVDGRSYQLWFHLTWDLIFPILGFLFVGLIISWLMKRSFKKESKLQRMNLLALESVFDILENVIIVIMIVIYPAQLVSLAWLKTLSTMIKYCFAFPIVMVILLGLYKAARNRFKVQ